MKSNLYILQRRYNAVPTYDGLEKLANFANCCEKIPKIDSLVCIPYNEIALQFINPWETEKRSVHLKNNVYLGNRLAGFASFENPISNRLGEERASLPQFGYLATVDSTSSHYFIALIIQTIIKQFILLLIEAVSEPAIYLFSAFT